MVTAKTIQLMDSLNNNVSPATGIESIYFEFKSNDIVYRSPLNNRLLLYGTSNALRFSHSSNKTGTCIIENMDTNKKLLGDSSIFATKDSNRVGLITSSKLATTTDSNIYTLDVSLVSLHDLITDYTISDKYLSFTQGGTLAPKKKLGFGYKTIASPYGYITFDGGSTTNSSLVISSDNNLNIQVTGNTQLKSSKNISIYTTTTNSMITLGTTTTAPASTLVSLCPNANQQNYANMLMIYGKMLDVPQGSGYLKYNGTKYTWVATPNQITASKISDSDTHFIIGATLSGDSDTKNVESYLYTDAYFDKNGTLWCANYYAISDKKFKTEIADVDIIYHFLNLRVSLGRILLNRHMVSLHKNSKNVVMPNLLKPISMVISALIIMQHYL